MRFRREALAAAALDHPFICKIDEVGEDGGRSFLVLEYIEGRTLDAVARGGGLTPTELLDVAHEIVQALEEAHRRGVVHRDLKPSNIMLTIQGHVKVLDFGLAKQIAPERSDEAWTEALTDSGTRVGTPSYMSPEQISAVLSTRGRTCFPSGPCCTSSRAAAIRFSKGTSPTRWPRSCAILRRRPKAISMSSPGSGVSFTRCSPRRAPIGSRRWAR